MENLFITGLCKSIGVSNFNVQLLLDLLRYTEIKPVCKQTELHPYLTQKDLASFCKKICIEIVAYSPLCENNPALKDKLFLKIMNKQNVELNAATLIKDPTIKKLSDKYSKIPSQIVLSWRCETKSIYCFRTQGEF